jgi:hypothetical protein
MAASRLQPAIATSFWTARFSSTALARNSACLDKLAATICAAPGASVTISPHPTQADAIAPARKIALDLTRRCITIMPACNPMTQILGRHPITPDCAEQCPR